jgi:hypothetical protein
VPAAGDGLTHYRVMVDANGDVFVDLRTRVPA